MRIQQHIFHGWKTPNRLEDWLSASQAHALVCLTDSSYLAKKIAPTEDNVSTFSSKNLPRNK